MTASLSTLLQQHQQQFYPVIPLTQNDRLLPLDLSESNPWLTTDTITDTEKLSAYINRTLSAASATFGIGGYNELRNLYARSEVFDGEEPRRLHLGVDIWGPAGTPVFAPLNGTVHSVAYNGSFGDYGATIILQHQLENRLFHTLYGHLSLASLAGKVKGQSIATGEKIAGFGPPAENGAWPPHLHFQLIENMEGMQGDYPGVCRYSEKEKYLRNCPDANLMLASLFFCIK